jgi:hypothetical protein
VLFPGIYDETLVLVETNCRGSRRKPAELRKEHNQHALNLVVWTAETADAETVTHSNQDV